MNESEETVSSATETADTEDDLYAPPYAVGNGCLSIERVTKNGSGFIPLCNFAPRILSEVSYDDGAEVIRKYRIGGTHADGRPLPPVDVPASDLEKMEWIANNWDATCDLFRHLQCGEARPVRDQIHGKVCGQGKRLCPYRLEEDQR